MISTFNLVLILASGIASVLGDKSECPNMKPAKNLDLAKITTGTWYHQYHEERDALRLYEGNKCITSSYSGLLKENKEYDFFAYNRIISVKTNEPNFLVYTVRIAKNKVMSATKISGDGHSLSVNRTTILTDNETYMVNLQCGISSVDQQYQYSIRIYTRCEHIPSFDFKKLDKLLEAHNVDIKFVRVVHDNCY